MKIAESWLREWVDPDFDTEALAHRLTMTGHEVDGINVDGDGIDDVVVAEVVSVDKHPDADRLSVCKVSDGGDSLIEVVCGAPNVVAGMKSPLAKPGTKLPNGIKLRKSKIRGVTSNGMLCSAIELGLGDESDGIIALPQDAEVGTRLVDFLQLPDAVLDVNLTPNRGDCFSVLGIARDVAALSGAAIKSSKIDAVPATIDASHPVETPLPEGCPVFAGRVIKGIDSLAQSPLWMTERLRRAGLRAIHPVVDVTNYVMLELGQPLHAYDLDKLQGSIRPRLAKQGEKLTLLDDKEISVNADTLVISDDSGAIGLAGIMGGLSTAVSADTRHVFFEAAFWPQAFVAGRARAYGLHTDASLRFERGVDPEGQARAVERATGLLLEIAGGEAGPLVETTSPKFLPQRNKIRLRRERIGALLGVQIDDAEVQGILDRLGLTSKTVKDGWDVTAPGYRFDIDIEVDLIEEIARIYGYDAIPEQTAIAETPLSVVTEAAVDLHLAAATLVARDYQEVVTYSFIDADSNQALTGMSSGLVLSNPISSEMSVMRGSLLPGMLMAAMSNVARQQDRVRLFEIGKSFHGSLDQHTEVLRLALVATGGVKPEQWGSKTANVDFFDLKADVEALLKLTVSDTVIRFESCEHPALQPGQAANVFRGDQQLGVIGKLHPRHAKRFDLKRPIFVCELDADAALTSTAPIATSISKYPSIRRDIAVVVDENISADALLDAVRSAAPALIADVRIFDIYQGPGIEAGLKSVALGLILQETSRTLTDDDADAAMAAAVGKLNDLFAAELRE